MAKRSVSTPGRYGDHMGKLLRKQDYGCTICLRYINRHSAYEFDSFLTCFGCAEIIRQARKEATSEDE